MTDSPHVTTIYDDVRNSQRVMSTEFALRVMLVTIAAASSWFLLDLWLVPVWVVVYYFFALLERYVVSLPVADPPGFAFARLWIVSFALATVYAALPVYVWSLGTDTSKLATGLLFTAAALNIFLMRARNWKLALAYLLPMSGATFVISATYFEPPYGGVNFWSITVICICLTIYFGVCLWEAHRSNAELRETRAQFIQAQKVEALGTLTSGVAHDFNNLLSVVQGNLELMQTYPDAPDYANFLDAALQASRRGAKLTRQLTSYGRKADMWPVQITPAKALSGIQEIAARVLPANITLNMTPANSDSEILVDETLLHSALLNLVINARDAMPDGGVLRIDVIDPAPVPATLNAMASAGYIAFRVSDTGEGIPPDVLLKVRDPFFSTKPTGSGSGLGLPMVCGFAQQSGGDVDISSTVGQGTSVQLILPRAGTR